MTDDTPVVCRLQLKVDTGNTLYIIKLIAQISWITQTDGSKVESSKHRRLMPGTMVRICRYLICTQ